MEAMLPTIWAAIIAFAILVYVLLDGFDLGVGVLFTMTREETHRRSMMDAIAPVWDGNETWLIIVGASLFGAFPMVYSLFLAAFYLPVTLLLVALILRGVAFEFRYKTRRLRWLWDLGFSWGSVVAAFVQGAAIGAMVAELPVEGGRYVGGPLHWLAPFPIACGLGLVAGYGLLGAGWLVLKTRGDLRDLAYRWIPYLLIAVIGFLLLAFAVALLSNYRVMDRWMGLPWLLVFPSIGLLACAGVAWGVRARRDWQPYGMTVLVFLAAFGALAGSFWPYLVPFSVTIAEAAAPTASLSFLFYGAGLVVLPVILIYTAVVYWIFRGKVGAEGQSE